MCSTYGRSLKGERIKVSNPIRSNESISLIGAIGLDKIVDIGFIKGSVKSSDFEIFLKDFLLPKLSSGYTIVLDNYSTHNPIKVSKICNDFGVKVLFLPPYSPDLSPIELCWSKIKNFVRKDMPRTIGNLFDSIKKSILGINDYDLESWYEHCGYELKS